MMLALAGEASTHEAQADITQPLPVILPLSSWAVKTATPSGTGLLGVPESPKK